MITKLTFEEKREIILETIISQLENYGEYFKIKRGTFYSSDKAIKWIFKLIYEDGISDAKNIDEDIKIRYGFGTKKLENQLFKIIYYNSILKMIPETEIKKSLLKNVQDKIDKYIPEYEIKWTPTDGWIELPLAKQKIAVAENLSDFPEVIAKDISELLTPNITEKEIVGLISFTYKEIEKIYADNLNNLNEVDKSLFKKSKNLAKALVNNVDGAKGHKGKSSLSITDIAHNYALNISLCQKLIHKNSEINKSN